MFPTLQQQFDAKLHETREKARAVMTELRSQKLELENRAEQQNAELIATANSLKAQTQRVTELEVALGKKQVTVRAEELQPAQPVVTKTEDCKMLEALGLVPQ